MKEIIKGKFIFDYENDSTSSYLVINMRSDENILEYQIEMLHNNRSQEILSLDMRQKNDEIKLYYNITSKLSLSQFLQRKRLSKNEFINMLRGVTKTLLKSKEYFLYDNSFIIDEDYIYINPSNLEIRMVYLPMALDTNVCENFKNFLGQLIVSSAKIDEDSSGNYIQKILNYLKNDDFNISDFDKLLRDIKNKTDKSSGDRKKQLSHLNQGRSYSNNGLTNPNANARNVNLKNNDVKPTIHGKMSSSKIFDQPEEEGEATITMQYDRKYIVIAILSQILIAIALTFSLDTIKAVAGDDISAYGGAALIIAAIDILLFRYLFKQENMKEIKIVNKDVKYKSADHNTSVNMSKREIHNIKETYPSMDSDKEDSQAYELVDSVSINKNETVILDEGIKESAYLQRMSNGIMDKVTITKENFIIGRLPDYVDHLIKNNAIGRTHAEIVFIEGQYFIKDLNSKNGTFINEVRVESNKEYQINNGDIVKLANIEYTFRLS